MKQNVSIGGSGSTFLYGYVDAHYKKDMSKEECIELAKTCVTLAINRDGSSGGCVRCESFEIILFRLYCISLPVCI